MGLYIHGQRDRGKCNITMTTASIFINMLILGMIPGCVCRQGEAPPKKLTNVRGPPCLPKSELSFYWSDNRFWPNICAVEEVSGSRRRYYSECMTYMPRTICEKPTYIRYHCCSGFERTDPEAKGCEGVVPISNLMETSKHLYLSEFRNYAQQSGMDNVLRHEGTFTLFAPQNKAFNTMSSRMRNLMSSRNMDENLIQYHMTPGRRYLHKLYDNLQLPSMLTQDGFTQPLKVNRYSNGIVTVNCARVILADQVATNGILHTLERAIEPIPNNATVMDLLLEDDRFGELVTALIITGFTQELLDKKREFTVFAPTDAAFRNAPPDVIERILNNKDVLNKVLRHHVLEQSICSAALLGLSRQRTLHGSRLNMSCDVNDNLLINGIPVSKTDIVGINGVIHVIDELLIPGEAKSIGALLADLGLHEFVEYAQGSGLSAILNAEAEGNYTLFVPSAAAFRGNWEEAKFSQALSREKKRALQTQHQARRRVFNYHVVPGVYRTDDLQGEQLLTTQSEGRHLRVKIYHRGFGINGAKILSSNHVAGNGVVHVIDKMLFPPEGNAMGRIQEEAKLSTFLSTLHTSGLSKLLIDIEGNYTVFAPTNDAFDAMEGPLLEKLLVNSAELEKFIKYHILKHPVYPSSIKPRLQYRFKTLAKEWLSLKQEAKGEPVIVDGEAKVEGTEVESSNAIIYHIDHVLKCPCVESINDVV